MSILRDSFINYIGTREGFDAFHNEVMNMPRDEFGSAGLQKIQKLASYLLLIEDDFPPEGCNYKQFLELIMQKINIGIVPTNFRDVDFENRYLTLGSNSIDEHYNSIGRMFRHLMGICAFFDLINSISRQNKIINFETCRILTKSDDDILISVFRNILINLNINNNDYIKNLQGITGIQASANYRPASAILKYLSKITDRPVTLFEISVLLGRIDTLQTENEILDRALAIGHILPATYAEQKNMLFRELEWINSDHIFDYAASQGPDFKFKSFILYMKDLGLVEINEVNKTIRLTPVSIMYVEEEVIPDELLDLESLINKIQDETTKDSELLNLIVKKRTRQLMEALNQENSILLKKINQRAITNVVYDAQGKRKRNKFIAELAKLKAQYTCQVTRSLTFRMPNGDNYVEAHHLIEFAQNGPDIVENLLILGPEKHRLIHHACDEEKEDLYNHLKTTGVITFDLFKKMIDDYHCLNEEHLVILKNKKLISNSQYVQLNDLIRIHG